MAHSHLECRGMTETVTNTSNPLCGAGCAGPVGLPVPRVELRVADEEGDGVQEVEQQATRMIEEAG